MIMGRLSSDECLFCNSNNVKLATGCFRDIDTLKKNDDAGGLVCSDCGKTTLVTYDN